MARKSSGTNIYFGTDVENAIIDYNNETDIDRKNSIFQTKIYNVFSQLIEVWIHRGKHYNLDETITTTKQIAMNHLLDRLNLYKAGHGKAYSYFTVITKHHFIQRHQELCKSAYTLNRLPHNLDMDNDVFSKAEKNIYDSIVEEENESTLQKRVDFFDLFVKYLNYNLYRIFKKEQDVEIAGAILHIIDRRENLDRLNKKFIYIYIKEITCNKYNSQQIAKVLNIYRKIFKYIYAYYDANDTIDMNYIPPTRLNE